MSLYDLSQFDGLRREDISGFARFRFADEIQNPRRLGERILPFVQVDDWQVEASRFRFRPVASAIIGPDSPLPRTPLGTFDSRIYGLLKGGRKTELKESEIRKLRQIFGRNGRRTPEQVLNSEPYMFADGLVRGYLDLAEAMRWEALTTGTYVIPNSNGTMEVDFGFEANQQIALTTTDLWSASATADGLGDILAWNDLVYTALGVNSEYTVISRQALENLLAQEATKTRLANAGYAGIGGVVAPNANQLGIPFFIDSVNGYLARYGVGPLVLYDRTYDESDPYGGDGQRVTRRFLPANAFVMVAPTPVDGGTGFGRGTSVGYQADGPVTENEDEPGIFVWLTERDEPFEIAVKSVFWTLSIISDPRVIVSGTHS